MRMLPLATCVASFLFLFLVSAGPFTGSLVGRAEAQAQKQTQSQEDLLQKCRAAVFRKYGQLQPEYGGRMIALSSDQFTRAFDQCVASRGQNF
jgi:hypothetical protein